MHQGPHALRHACATHLLSQGLPIKEIGFSLHPDGIIALSMTLAMLALTRGRAFQAGVCAAVVMCAKLPLLLLAATLDLKNAMHRKAMFFCALIIAAAYLPFLFPDPAQPFAEQTHHLSQGQGRHTPVELCCLAHHRSSFRLAPPSCS